MAPGGYEVWNFVAGDASSDTWVMAAISWGTTFWPEYLRRYERYRASPTRVRPPVAKEFCCASLAVYVGGREATRFDVRVNGDEFGVSKGESGVHVGANRLTVDGEGKLHLHLRGRPMRKSWYRPMHEQTVSATLTFEPLAAGVTAEAELADGAGPLHRWTVSRPLCKVNGEVSIYEVEKPRVIGVKGLGAHDHAWGVRPLSWDFQCGFRGVVLADDRAIALRWQENRRGKKRRRAIVVGADAGGAKDVEMEADIQGWKRLGLWGLKYPMAVRFGDVLRLENPRVLGASLFDMRVAYEAKSRGPVGVAICEVVNWARLRSALMGRAVAIGTRGA
jgi:hypothetical protein